MNKRSFRKTPLALALSAALGAAFIATKAVPAGPVTGDVPVNTVTTDVQYSAAVAMNADGHFVVTWSAPSNGVYTSETKYEIFARRFAAGGSPLTGEIAVNTYTTGDQVFSLVAMNATGDFVVVWTSEPSSSSNRDVSARRFAADGSPLGGEIAVNGYTTDDQVATGVVMDAVGNFVVSWSGEGSDPDFDGVYARRFAADGTARGGDIAVNAYTTGSQGGGSVAMDAGGNFVVVWTDSGRDGSQRGIYGRRFMASGIPVGADFSINTYTTGHQESARVAMAADGRFVVTWSSIAQDGSVRGVYAQRFSAEGTAAGAELAVNSFTTNSQQSPDVSVDASGDFVITWTSNGPDGDSFGVVARRFSADGKALGAEFTVNSYTTSSQNSSKAAMDADGDFAIVWESAGQDLSSDGVYARVYRGDEAVNLAISQYDSADPVRSGETLGYTLHVNNLHLPSNSTSFPPAIAGALGAASGLRVIDTLPADAGEVSLPPLSSGWACSRLDRVATCDLAAALPAGEESPPLRFVLNAPDGAGPLVNNARVVAVQSDPDLSNNRSREVTRVDCRGELRLVASSLSLAESVPFASFTVERVGGSCGAASVQIDASSASALAGQDYLDATDVLSWADGDASPRTFTLPLIDDALDEYDERIVVQLGAAQGAPLGSPARAVLSLKDNDAPPRVNFTRTAETLTESGTLVTLGARLSAVSGRPVQVPLLRSGSATRNADYFQAENALSFPAGAQALSLDIELIDDAADEPDETLVLSFGTPSGAVAGSLSQYTLTIANNDAPPPPTVSFSAASSTGDEATTRALVLQLSAASAVPVTVSYTVSGSAALGPDYTLNRPSPVTINPGVTQLGIQSVPVNDTEDESDETVVLTLGAATNATLGAITVHTRTIVDNDP